MPSNSDNDGEKGKTCPCGCGRCGCTRNGYGRFTGTGFILRLLIGIIVLLLVFWIGFHLGEFHSMFGGGYRMTSGFRGYSGYGGGRMPMMMRGGTGGGTPPVPVNGSAGSATSTLQ
jgi:hypothetical protein